MHCVLTTLCVCSGECRTCPNEGLPIGERTFKDDPTESTDACKPCYVCGGPNQDGTQYEVGRCTPTSDTVCADCELCAGDAVRIACAGPNPGRCVTIAEGVDTVLATQSVSMDTAIVLPGGGALTTEPAVIAMGGDFPGAGVDIPAGTTILLPEEERRARREEAIEISVSVIGPSDKMLKSAKKQGFNISSPLFYYGMSGLRFDPYTTLNLLLNDTALEMLASFKFRQAVVRWNVKSSAWEEIPNCVLDGNLVKVNHTRFSAYTAIIAPIDLSLSLNALTSPDLADAGVPKDWSAPTNTPEVPAPPAPEQFPVIIVVSVVAAVCLLVFIAAMLWYCKRKRDQEGLAWYLQSRRKTMEMFGADEDDDEVFPDQPPDQDAIDAKLAEIPMEQELANMLVRMPSAPRPAQPASGSPACGGRAPP